MFTVLIINFERYGIRGCSLNQLENRHPELEFEQIFEFSGQNRGSYRCLNMVHLATQNLDYTYALIVGRKTGSQTFHWQIWFSTIFPITWGQSVKNQILGKNMC